MNFERLSTSPTEFAKFAPTDDDVDDDEDDDGYQNDQSGHDPHYNSHIYQHDATHFAGVSASSLISRGKYLTTPLCHKVCGTNKAIFFAIAILWQNFVQKW